MIEYVVKILKGSINMYSFLAGAVASAIIIFVFQQIIVFVRRRWKEILVFCGVALVIMIGIAIL